jgi:hypothetical protein
MTAESLASGNIDPRLLEHFALFREPGPGPDGALDEDEAEVVTFREELASGSSHVGQRLARLGLVFNEVRRVALDSERVMLVIPGRAGLFMHVRNGRDHGCLPTSDHRNSPPGLGVS